ncbi:unnamed protein product [Paramecium primaurelia]|uniref:Uncharacterized protein n=1 Tax=Paramecium primaurelia TaxID=5886 RepID=A0A8S1JQ32_PARPR|nr:unnamed protein product [Paramecium primaurelia]
MLVYNSSFDEFMLKAKHDSNEKQEYKVYTQRWFVLLAFCAFTFCNALGFVQYTPILKMAASYYDVDEDGVAWFSICYYITYFLLAPFSIKPLDIRLDYSLFFAAFLTSLGQWTIYFAHQNYAIAMIGFVLIGIGQIFILAAPAYISDRWFPVHERTVSTCLGSFLNLLGLNFSIFYSSITFEELSGQLDNIIKEIDFMNLIYSIMNTVAFVMCLLMIQNKPPSPPSFSAVIIYVNYFGFRKNVNNEVIQKSFQES